MSLVRIGMSENKGYADGYEAIFGKRERFKLIDEPDAAPTPADDQPKPAPEAETPAAPTPEA